MPIKKSRYLIRKKISRKKIRYSLSKLKNDLEEEEKEAPKYVTAATREIERWRPPCWISLFFIYFLSSSACGLFIIIGFQSFKQRKEEERTAERRRRTAERRRTSLILDRCSNEWKPTLMNKPHAEERREI